MNSFRIFILVFALFTGYNANAGTGRDTFTVNFSKGSYVLDETEQAKFMDLIVFRDSITDIYIVARPDENSNKCRSCRLARKRGKAIKSYLSSKGIPGDRIKVDYDIGKSSAAIPYRQAFIIFSYRALFKMQSDN